MDCCGRQRVLHGLSGLGHLCLDVGAPMGRGGHKVQCHAGEEPHAVRGAGSHSQEHHCRRQGGAPPVRFDEQGCSPDRTARRAGGAGHRE
eukprot:12252353-Heterocapsa_arctica.AAC.1